MAVMKWLGHFSGTLHSIMPLQRVECDCSRVAQVAQGLILQWIKYMVVPPKKNSLVLRTGCYLCWRLYIYICILMTDRYCQFHVQVPQQHIWFSKTKYHDHVIAMYNTSSNIPETLAYGVFGSQLIRCVRVCSKNNFLFRGSILVSKLLKQGYSPQKLHTIFWNLYGRHTNLVHKIDTSMSHMLKCLLIKCDI